MTRKLCFLSAKGGAGKTTTAAALGTLISLLGKRVLIVDTDASTNGMTLLYLNQLIGMKKGLGKDCFGLFDENDAIHKIDISENLSFVPATYHMAETTAVEEGEFRSAVDTVVKFGSSYDFIILDAQAGTDIYAQISAAVADEIVIVSEYDPLSAQGTDRLKAHLSSDIDPSQTWILFNKVLPEFASLVGDGLAIARYLPPIPWDPDVVRALARRDIALNLDEPNPYTLSIMAIANEIYPDELGTEITSWKEKILKSTVDPVDERLREIGLQIHMQNVQLKRSEQIKVVWTSALTAAVAIIAALTTVYELMTRGDESPQEVFLSAAPAGALAAAAATAIAVLAMYYVRNRGRSRPNAELFHVSRLRSERERLRAARDASRSALENIGKPGFYGQRRRETTS